MDDDTLKKYILLSLSLFFSMLLGAVIGSGITILYFKRLQDRHPPTPDQTTKLISARISSSVKLTPEEREKTEELVKARMAEVAEIRKKYEDEVTEKLGSMSDGLNDILGSERADKCGGWMRRFRGGSGEHRDSDDHTDCRHGDRKK